MLGRRCSYDSFLPPHHGQNGNGFGSLSFDPTMANLLARANSNGQSDQVPSRFPSLSSKGSNDYNGAREMFVHSGIPFILDSQGGNPGTTDISGGDAFGTDPAVAGLDLLTIAPGTRHELNRSGTGSSCGDRPSRGESFRRTDSTNSDQPLLLFSKTDDSAAYGSGQLDEGGPPAFITQGPPVLQTAESETGPSSMSTLPSASYPVADSCSTTASMENLINQAGASGALHSSGPRFVERVPSTLQSCTATESGAQTGRGESLYCSSGQRMPMDRTGTQQRMTGGSVGSDCHGLWQGGAQLHVAPEQYRVVYPHQGHGADVQSKWETGTGQYHPPPGTPYVGTAYHWSGDWFGAEQQHQGASKNSFRFDQRETEGTREGALPGTGEDQARALSDSGVMSLTTDAYFSAAHSEAVSPASSVPSDKGCVAHHGVAADEPGSCSAEGALDGVSSSGNNAIRSSSSSLAPPTGNSTATTSPGIAAEASCSGSLAAPDEASVLPSRTTGTTSSSDSGDAHSEGGDGSEGGDRCITELTKGNRCIRGAPRATVQQLYGQTYDLEALALEIDRTSLDAMDTGEIRRDYYPGVKFPVGDLGRKLLLIAVREKMEAGTCGQLKFLTLTDLFRLAYELGMWSFALKVSMAYKAGGLRIPKGGLGGGRGGGGRDELWCAKESRRRRKGRKSNRSRTKAGTGRVAKADQDGDALEDEEEEEHLDTMAWPPQGKFQAGGGRVDFGEERGEINEGHFVNEAESKGINAWGMDDTRGMYIHGLSEGPIETRDGGDFRQGQDLSAQKAPEILASREPAQLRGLLPEEELQSMCHGNLMGEHVSQQAQSVKGQLDFDGYAEQGSELGATQWPGQTQSSLGEGGAEELDNQPSLRTLRVRARPSRVRRGRKRSRTQNFEGEENEAMPWETDGQENVGWRYDGGLAVPCAFSADNPAVLGALSGSSSVFVYPKTQHLEAGVVLAGRREAGPSREKVARVEGNTSDGFELGDRFNSGTDAREFQCLQSAGASDATLMSVLQGSGVQTEEGGDPTVEVGGLLPPPSDAVENGCQSSVSPAEFANKDLYFYGQLPCAGPESVGTGRTDLNTSSLGDGNVNLEVFRQTGGVDYSLKGRGPPDYDRSSGQEEQNRAPFCQVADDAGAAVGDWISGNH
ncbi:hypothetical protein TGME49_285250 [Toxoplasma gondii ME49]|uniref:Uncharacterized protein n=8 Tax=Toxoplasma gondii TaxID=5811 RepID=S7UNQ9_TOXGG|nr:hypothetical protein TGME49_285250 [Toxoplasma gondii ME49]EPR59360.1 hypothetical protein TGGT1_285250 [Toxoplasma gondii GT1]KAF4643902.1 hypothetical protein TGRH88_026580 [Toxoplasma gondii]KFG54690.1 hypothetical protein TGFOU_285250 [Toxoplasma gondii FOU]KYF43901.1 hypothetical protein TGARI_285250 [Toxoplasma gondii ARI]PIM00304.1 hypothetical protein TGCOUG_285250 [Toxoplasma gondii COUG]PUA87958.1 hypothetical protein TGBR9_285250 [Toxoplasma gondii TgCATBr9]RQX69848.1 hypotheti|eukprot:XP_002369183.2 hypothetical protein TGME49_285250 [Toxoplasma gondii ME49]